MAQKWTERALWAIGIFFVAELMRQDWLGLEGLHVKSGAIWGRDFINVWTGGRLTLDGHLEWLYTLDQYKAFQNAQFGRIDQHNYSYPPIALLLNVPFALLPYGLALALWTIAGAFLFALAARLYLRPGDGIAPWTAVLTPAAMVNIWAGHYGFLIGALWLFAFALYERRPKSAGAITALLLLKPHLAILMPAILLWRRQWMAIIAAAIGVAALVLLSGLLFGFDLWRQYLFDVSALQSRLIFVRTSLFHLMMPTVAVALKILDVPQPMAMVAQAASAVLAVALLWRLVRKPIAIMDLAFPAATATFLILPYAFNYDMTVACLGFIIALNRNWKEITPAERTVLALAFISPCLTMILSYAGLPLAPFILLMALAIQVRIAEGRAYPADADKNAQASNFALP